MKNLRHYVSRHSRLAHKVGASLVLLGLAAFPVSAQRPMLYDGGDGATCDYYNSGARIAWVHRQGDWTDTTGAPQGALPFSQTLVRAADDGRVAEWDLTPLVRLWLSEKLPNDGLMMASVRGPATGTVQFHSREAAAVRLRPTLVVTFDDGSTQRIPSVADTTLDCTTYTSLGRRPILTAGANSRLLMQFDLAVLSRMPVTKAALELTVLKSYGDASLGVFANDVTLAARGTETQIEIGLAASYPRDRGIGKNPAVIMATGFDTPSWRNEWSYVSERSAVERVDRSPALGFQPLNGQALKVKIPSGENLGLDMGYRFADKIGAEPEEIFFRYYLRLANDWKPADGGKLPGISATYSKSGWGGRKANGTTGWSMRGLFYPPPENGNPFHELTPIGTYAYHADMKEDFGDGWKWSGNDYGVLARDRWYCIEQQFRVNQLGRKDGMLRAWVDGKLVFEKAEIHVRDLPLIRIEQIWMNVYYGGTAPSPTDLHLFIDNVVVARKYIGPMTE